LLLFFLKRGLDFFQSSFFVCLIIIKKAGIKLLLPGSNA
jgi:hypothetical protein